VCIAIRENEVRAKVLGYNTFYFKLAALVVVSVIAALAGTIDVLHKLIVSPEIATMGYTVDALQIILIGGIGTLSGAMIGAGVCRFLALYLAKWFGESAGYILGAVYVALVLFVPYGIIGTWRQRSLRIKEGWQRLLGLVGFRGGTPAD
jgi:branched-chain amino acid transport system permease protein